MAATSMVAFNRVFARSRVRVSERALDSILVLGFFVLGLAIRVPYLMLMPSFTDETVEVLYSLKVSQGKLFPLTNADPYYGSIYNYIVVGVFHVFGPSAEVARLTVTVLGALAIPLTYLLAKEMEGRLAGHIVALLMLTSGALILNGHVAWENNTTPFFAAAMLLLLVLALKRGSGMLLVASGLLYGLTLQTHPGVIVLAPGLVLHFVYSGLRPRACGSRRTLGSWLKSPWPYMTLVAGAVGYANVIIQSVIQPWVGWTTAQKHDYAFERAPTMDTYLTNLQNFVVMVLRVAGSNFDGKPVALESFLQPLNILYAVLLVTGIVYVVKRGKTLPVIALVTVGLILPYFNKNYGFPGAARYVGYLFPLVYLLVAAPLAQAARSISCQQGLRAAYPWLIIAFVVALPLAGLVNNYRATERAGATNAQVLSIHESLRQRYLSGTVSQVIIDSKVSQFK